MDGVAQVPAIRRSALTAAAVWIALHLMLALLFADGADAPGWYAAGLLVFLAGCALALAPLVRRPAPEPGWVVPAIVAATVLSSLLDVVSLAPGNVVGYSNWAAGATGVLIAGLVLRDHGLLAAGSTAAIVAIQTVAYVALPEPAEIARVAQLAIPPELWLLGSWAVRGLIRRADTAAVGLRSRQALEAARRAAGERQAEVRADLLDDLDQRVAPVLRVVAAGRGPITGAEAEAAARAASALRDDLRARSLLVGDVRRALAAARERGCRVLLSSELPAGPASEELGRLLVAVLAAAPASVVLRARHRPDEATLVVGAGPGTAAFEAMAGERAPGWTVRRVLDVDGELIATLLRLG